MKLIAMFLALSSATAIAAPADNGSGIVSRSTIGLPLARKMLAAAEAEAARNKVAVSIIIVDDRGSIILAERMDGAGVASFDVATAKARTAAELKVGTADLGKAYKAGATELATLNGHLPHPGGVALIGGGVPVQYRSAVVGAVGVSGAAPEVDAQIAAAAAEIVAKQE